MVLKLLEMAATIEDYLDIDVESWDDWNIEDETNPTVPVSVSPASLLTQWDQPEVTETKIVTSGERL